MNFAQAFKKETQKTFTENGQVAYNTTGNCCVDLFGVIGALRNRTEEEIQEKFRLAFEENPELAIKMAFYAGDIRGGLGERRTFRILLKWLAQNKPSIVLDNLHLIDFYNRFDSLFELEGTPCEEAMWEFVDEQLSTDLMNMMLDKPVSLLAKWLPSENASSEETRRLARKTMNLLALTAREYRKLLSDLRKYTDVVETKMSEGNWDKIDYENVPSYAMRNYRDAFARHDTERFGEYLNDLEDGKVKINSSVLYPYDIVGSYNGNNSPVLEEQWKALPNYIGTNGNFVVMADVSGSMIGHPMDSAVGLAIYFAERNQGVYHNLFMTFSHKPEFVCLDDCKTLAQKIYKTTMSDWGMDTDLEEAFRSILNVAFTNQIAPEDMPKALIVVSDMEINEATDGMDFLDAMHVEYAQCGYELPKIVFWNVDSRNDTFISQSEQVLLISGQSISSFKNLMGALDGKTAYDFMLEVLNDKRYDRIKIDFS